jgi:hypothetical protein
MKNALLMLALTACAASNFEKTDPFEVFLSELGAKSQQTACQKVSQSQYNDKQTPIEIFQNCMRDTNELKSAIISDFRPIGLKVIDEAVSNVNETYYQMSPDTKRWTLGGRLAPPSIDGDMENAKILAAELDRKFKLLVEAKFRELPKEGSNSGLSKRGIRIRLPKFKLPKFIKPKGVQPNAVEMTKRPVLNRMLSDSGSVVNAVARVLGLAALRIFFVGMMIGIPAGLISVIFFILHRAKRSYQGSHDSSEETEEETEKLN